MTISSKYENNYNNENDNNNYVYNYDNNKDYDNTDGKYDNINIIMIIDQVSELNKFNWLSMLKKRS